MEQDRVLGGDAPGADDAVPLLEVGDDGAFDLDAMPAEDAAPPAPPPSTAAAGARGGVRSARLRGGGGGGGGGGDSGAEKTFESCKTFSGNRDGWVFKLGGRGIGYYKDRGPAQPGMGAAASSAYYHFASTGEKHASKWDSYDVEAEMAKVDVDSAEEDSGEEGGGGGGGAEEVSRASFGAKQAKAKAKAKAAKAKAEEAVRRERSAEHDKRSALEQARDDAACPGRSPEQCEMVAQVMVLSDAQVGGMPPAQRAQVEPMRAMERRRLAALAEASKVPGRSHEQAQAIAQCMCLTEEQLCEMPEEQQDMIRNMRSNEGARLKRMAQGGAAELSPEAAMAEARAKAKCEGRTEEQVDAIARVMSMTEAEVRALDDPKQREQVESMRQMEGQRQAAEDALSAPGGPKGQPKLTPEQEAAKTAAAHAAQWEKYVAGMRSATTADAGWVRSAHDGKARSPAEQAAQLAAATGVSQAVALEQTTGRAATEPQQRPGAAMPATQNDRAQMATMKKVVGKAKAKRKDDKGKSGKKAQMAAMRKQMAKAKTSSTLGDLNA